MFSYLICLYKTSIKIGVHTRCIAVLKRVPSLAYAILFLLCELSKNNKHLLVFQDFFHFDFVPKSRANRNLCSPIGEK